MSAVDARRMPPAGDVGRPFPSPWPPVLVGFTLALLVQWVLILRGLYAISADEPARILLAEQFSASGRIPIMAWLPLPTVITGGLLRFWPDPFWGPRALTVVTGALAAGVFSWWATMLTQRTSERVVAALLIALFPARAILGATPLAESFLFLTAGVGCVLTASAVRQRSRARLLAAAAAICAASLTRYEAWPVTMVFVALVGLGDWPWRTKLLCAGVATSGIAAWLGTLAATDNDAMLEAGRQFNRLYGEIRWVAIAKSNVITQFVKQNVVAATLPGIAWLYWCRADRDIRRALALPVGSLIVLGGMSLTGAAIPVHNTWRVPTFWSLLLLPFAAIAIVRFCSSSGRTYRLAGAVWAAAITISCAVALWRAPEQTHFSRDDLRVARFLHERMRPSDRVLIDSQDWSFYHVVTATPSWPQFEPMHGWWADRQHGEVPLEPRVPAYEWVVLRTRGLVDRAQADSRLEPAGTFGPWSAFRRIAPQPPG